MPTIRQFAEISAEIHFYRIFFPHSLDKILTEEPKLSYNPPFQRGTYNAPPLPKWGHRGFQGINKISKINKVPEQENSYFGLV